MESSYREGGADAHRSGLRSTGVVFSPDDTLPTLSGDGTVRVYVLPLDQLMELARSRLTRRWTSDECRRSFPASTVRGTREYPLPYLDRSAERE